jgi:hypothetical protein
VPTTESSGRVPGDRGIEGDSAGKSYRKGPGERTEALVEEDVGIVTEALIALVTGAVTGVLGRWVAMCSAYFGHSANAAMNAAMLA